MRTVAGTCSKQHSAERETLISELASSRAEVARLSRAAGVAQERQRLAGEIHDTLAQGLSSVVMLIEAALAAAPEKAGRTWSWPPAPPGRTSTRPAPSR